MAHYEPYEKVSLTAKAKRETEKAILVDIKDQEDSQWIPKSQIDEESEVYRDGTEGTLIIPGWLANKILGGDVG